MPLNVNDYDQLKIHAMNGAQWAADESRAWMNALRYDYLEGRRMVDLTEALGPRYMQGPHPQHGSPDAE